MHIPLTALPSLQGGGDGALCVSGPVQEQSRWGPPNPGTSCNQSARAWPGLFLEGLGILQLPKELASRVTLTHLGFPVSWVSSFQPFPLPPAPAQPACGASEQTAALLACPEQSSGHSPRAG